MGDSALWNGGHCCESGCNVSWLFSIIDSRGPWEGSCTDCPSEACWDGSENCVNVGKVCWAICENGSAAAGVARESKKLCPSTSPLVLEFVENKSLRVRLSLCSAGTPWISTLWTDSSASLVNFVLVGLGSGELSFIHWPSTKTCGASYY